MNNFDSKFPYVGISYLNDRPLLETDLNLAQRLSDEQNRKFINNVLPSGFFNLKIDNSIIYNPNNELNTIAIAPMQTIINSHILNIIGNYNVSLDLSNYIKIYLGEAPDDGTREDLVFLQAAIEVAGKEQPIKEYGNVDGSIIDDKIIDPRVGDEASKRFVYKWKICVQNDIDFNKYPEGFGTVTSQKFDVYDEKTSSLFLPATDECFSGLLFNNDNNLWVTKQNNNNDDWDFTFALPLFRITRRNKKNYDIDNFNGSIDNANNDNNLRPDRKPYDTIFESDIIDLRRTSGYDYSYDYLLDKNLKNLLVGELYTNKNKAMKRIQFGAITYTNDQINNDESLIFLDSFNCEQTDNNNLEIKPIKGSIPEISGTHSPIYKPFITNSGLVLDGYYNFIYDIKNSNFDVNEGTIQFYINAGWHGFDENINQTFFKIKYGKESDENIMTFEKSADKLIFKRYYDTGKDNYEEVDLFLNANPIFARNVYLIRISWSKKINLLSIYLNGKLCNTSNLNNIYNCNLTPAYLQIGEIEGLAVDSNSYNPDYLNCIIDDFAIYNKMLGNTQWTNIPYDFINNHAEIYPSFNSIFRDFRDNDFKQQNLIKIIGPFSGTSFSLDAPYDCIFGSNFKLFYCDDTTEIITEPPDVNTDKITFKLIKNPDGSTAFLDKKIILIYELISKHGNGINDLPEKLLRAEIATDDNKHQEISYNFEDNTDSREVNLYNPRKIGNYIDKAYDYSEKYRPLYLGGSRLLEYYHIVNENDDIISPQSVCIKLPLALYGYKILYIKSACKLIVDEYNKEQIVKIPIENISLSNDIEIYLTGEFQPDDIFKLEIILGGISFDYYSNTKTVIGNITLSDYFEIQAQKRDNTFTIFTVTDETNSGIIESIGAIDNTGEVDSTIDNVNDNNYYFAFIQYSSNQIYNLIKIKITAGGINSHYITFSTYDLTNKPLNILSGAKIKVPMTITYQPKETEIISIWYEYTPYQGMLTNTTQKLFRLTPWKYFVSTLSSGNNLNLSENTNSLCNLINRLPGGLTFSHDIVGEDIELKNIGLPSNDINKKLIFLNDTFCMGLDDVFNLETYMELKKQHIAYQDDKLSGVNFEIYLYPNAKDIIRYCGMVCLVVNSDGMIMLLLISDDNEGLLTNQNNITCNYGDLFLLEGRPTIKIQK